MSEISAYISDAIADDAIGKVEDDKYSQRLIVALIAAEITKSARAEHGIDPGEVFEAAFDAVARKMRFSD